MNIASEEQISSTKGTKIAFKEQKLQKFGTKKSRNKNFKNPGTKVKKIWEQKLQKSEN
jgi:hypothetical protein